MIGAVVCLMGVAFIAHPTWLFGSEAADVDPNATSSSLALKALAVLITEGGAMMAGLAYVSVRMIGHRASAVVMVLYYGYVRGRELLSKTGNFFLLLGVLHSATNTVTHIFVRSFTHFLLH